MAARVARSPEHDYRRSSTGATQQKRVEAPNLPDANPESARRVEDAADAPVDAERVARQRRNKSAAQNVNKSI